MVTKPSDEPVPFQNFPLLRNSPPAPAGANRPSVQQASVSVLVSFQSLHYSFLFRKVSLCEIVKRFLQNVKNANLVKHNFIRFAQGICSFFVKSANPLRMQNFTKLPLKFHILPAILLIFLLVSFILTKMCLFFRNNAHLF
jgi:hypothetical protein